MCVPRLRLVRRASQQFFRPFRAARYVNSGPGVKTLAQSYYPFGISLTRPFGSKASRSGNGNRTVPDPVYIGKEVTMKLPNPINSTNKTNKSTNHLFYSTLVSGFLTLVTCAMLTPKTQHHAANYVEPRHQATDQTTKDIDPGYDWFY
jgi:hypothetical protein